MRAVEEGSLRPSVVEMQGTLCAQDHVLASRLGQALTWLAESRQEPALSAAAVKPLVRSNRSW